LSFNKSFIMKLISISAAVFLIILTATCNSTSGNNNSMEVTGTIEAIQMTSWQYGTHTISNDSTFYALRSDKADLGQFEGQTVTIKASKIEGYPVDGGPEFLEVEEVQE